MNNQVIITGASSGFGRATAETLAHHWGHTVYSTAVWRSVVVGLHRSDDVSALS